MAVKKSRTGKKKRPQYGPQGRAQQQAQQLTPQQIKEYKTARRANYGSIGLLIVAMILLLVAPNSNQGDVGSSVIVMVAYAITIVAGGLILYTIKYVVPERVKMTKITGGVMIGLGVFGLAMTAYSLTMM